MDISPQKEMWSAFKKLTIIATVIIIFLLILLIFISF